MTDIFGDVVDAGTIEAAATATLKAWMPSHIAHQERRLGLPARSLPMIASWPEVSDLEAGTNLATLKTPALVLVAPGTSGAPTRTTDGSWRSTWTLEVAVVADDRKKLAARRLAGVYLAAVRGCLLQNRTLGGPAENVRWVREDHSYSPITGGRIRAIYGAEYVVTWRQVVNDRLGPTTPPVDPYDPPQAPESPLTADITVVAKEPSTP